MSTDAANAAPAPPPAPQPTPADNWVTRRLHDLGTSLHDLSTALAPELHDAEQAAAKAAADAWQLAAAGLNTLVQRNSAELTQKIEAAVLAYVVSLAPGMAPESAAIASIVVKVVGEFLTFAEGKLAAQAATPLSPIGPPLMPSPAPAPEPAK